MGFTLATALAALEADAEVVVAELVPGVVEWNRDALGSCAGRPMDDPRAEVRVIDIADMLRDEREGFDAIVLDVDNGPDGLTLAANRWLYSAEGLAVLFGALRPGGVAAIWSAGPDKPFTKRLRGTGFVVEEVPVRAHAGKGTRHLIWVARKG
jgi:spermidine synthase